MIPRGLGDPSASPDSTMGSLREPGQVPRVSHACTFLPCQMGTATAIWPL